LAYTLSIGLALLTMFVYPSLHQQLTSRVTGPLLFLGKISFSIYLIHQPVLYLGQHHNWLGLSTWLAIPFALLLIWLMSWLSYLIFERTFINIYRKRPAAAP
jgi:peptidoglycan/LPS O-acetylase OafA/YrhL